MCSYLPLCFLLPWVGNTLRPERKDWGAQRSVPCPSQLADSMLVGTQDGGVSRAQLLSQCTALYFIITKQRIKEETPFLLRASWGLAHYPSPCHLKPQRIIWKNMRPFANQEKKNHMHWYNGFKCRCHYVQCLVLNVYSEQLRLQCSFHVPALFANSHGCALLCGDT